jgi:hypothetical protein
VYILLVSQQVDGQGEGTFEIPRSRFLEYTSDSISTQLQSLSTEASDCIKSWPCILMQEGRGQEEAHVGQITAVDVASEEIKFTITSLPSESAILNDDLWKIRADLDIEQFEFTRIHCAIKDRDLFPILGTAGHSFGAAAVSRFGNKPLPAPPRSDLILSRKIISEWSHSDIDDFLLEAGVRGLVAGRAVGSRRDRANAIAKFALENPTATTAENSLFSAFIVRTAVSPTIDAGSHDESGDTGNVPVEPQQGRAEGKPLSEPGIRGSRPERLRQVRGYFVPVGRWPGWDRSS